MNHNELATDLARHLAADRDAPRVCWENIVLDPYHGVRPDVFSIRKVLNPLRCQPWTCEVKVSRGDFLSDVRREKWKKYRRFSCRLFFAAPRGLIRHFEIPEGAGLFEYGLMPSGAMGWSMIARGSYCQGWTLSERDLMKLILGRWGS